MKNYIRSFIVICLITITSSCSLGDNDNAIELPTEFTISQIVTFSGGLTTLEQAFQITGLDIALDGVGDFTLLAPSDVAFENFLNGASLNDIPVDDLRQLLLNHVVAESLTTDELSSMGSGYLNTLSTLGVNDSNLSLYLDTTEDLAFNGGTTNNGATIIPELTNSIATNGIVHIVDAVIELPNLADFVAADPNLSSLISAINTDGLVTDFPGVLNLPPGGISPFTVFAPSNLAFDNLLSELEINSLDELDVDVLESVLNYHIVDSSNLTAADLNASQSVDTVNGEMITIGSANTLIDVNSRITNIITIDIQATNGIIHILDRVLLPTLE